MPESCKLCMSDCMNNQTRETPEDKTIPKIKVKKRLETEGP